MTIEIQVIDLVIGIYVAGALNAAFMCLLAQVQELHIVVLSALLWPVVFFVTGYSLIQDIYHYLKGR